MHVKPFFQSCFVFLPHRVARKKTPQKFDASSLGGPRKNKPETGRFFVGHLNVGPALEMRQS